MRAVFLHSNKIEVEPKEKALGDADENVEAFVEEEAVVVFTAVEEGDEDIDAVVDALTTEIKKFTEQVKTTRVVLYPYVHLTSKPAPPRVAKKLLNVASLRLKQEGFEVKKAPFGWYKAFTLSVKGHPLSELSREIHVGEKNKEEEEEVSQALKDEETIKSEFYIFDGEKLVEADKFNFEGHDNLKKFITYETKKVRAYEKEPPHIELMKKLELVDYEPGSDPGNLRFYPKGKLIKGSLEEWVTNVCLDFGAHEVETPIMLDMEQPQLKKYLHRFPARQYIVLSEKKRLFLRFAACFGQFLIAHDANISYKNLPLKIFEMTRYSFRREQRGELAGLKRLRAFTMPDMHTFARDVEQAKVEYKRQWEKSVDIVKALDLWGQSEIGFRITKDFYEKHKEWLHEVFGYAGKPVLVEMWNKRFTYFSLKFEINFIDAMEKATALSTVQIDVENAERFGITYTDENGEKKHPLILHASLSGAIERVMYALLEKAALDMQKGKKGSFPLWLAPTQVRIIPASSDYLNKANELADKLESAGIRVDVDDREESVNKRIMLAEKEWVPYIMVYGEKEEGKEKLPVRLRDEGKTNEYSLEELIGEITKKCEGFPLKKRTYPRLLSKRPIFRG